MACEPGAPAGIAPYTTTVRPEWGDYNGHLRDAFHALIFSYATDAWIEHIGLDAETRTRTHRSIYTLECHFNFLREVKVGETVSVATRVLAADGKRVHLYHAMLRCDGAAPSASGELLAASEQLLLHVDTTGPTSALFAEAVMSRVQAMWRSRLVWCRPLTWAG